MKHLLDCWRLDIQAANQMANLLQQLGVPADLLPSAHAMRAGCLAVQSPRAARRLRRELEPHYEQLVQHGVLGTTQHLRDLSAGELMVVHYIIDHLDVITRVIDDLLEHALSYQPVAGTVSNNHPEIQIGTFSVEGHRYQPIRIHLRLVRVDRLLMYSEAHGAPRVLLMPPELLHIDLPLLNGEVLFYAENGAGAAARTLALHEVCYG